ncbi:MAG TPA: response regulator transcription factor [Nocardioides sp.]|nr:response regulator transcription factor [Nocardioides sp.]
MTTTSSRSKVRILLVEDHALFAESLDLALTMEGYDVHRFSPPDGSGTGPGSTAALIAAAVGLRPRIVLLDLDLGAFADGTDLIHPLARSGANVVVVTASTDRARWGECVRYGARAVISKTRPLNDIMSVVRRIHHGLPVMSHEEREELLRAWHSQRTQQQAVRRRLSNLTQREREVLGQLMEGRQVREIARTRYVSEATVRTQVKSILAKLEVSSQLAAVGLARTAGWQPPTTGEASHRSG